MTMSRRWLWVPALLVALRAADAQETRFEIRVPAEARAEPLTGRVYVMISRTSETEPRLQISQTGGTPFFGRDVEKLAPGEAAVIDETDLGSPVATLREIPPGEYFVQAFVNVYSEFRRADGHVVWMHDDQWEGQKWNISPGNLHSRVQKIRLDPDRGYRIPLTADQVIPPVEIPPDSSWVKRFRFESPLLTKFWGRPVYLGATVLLPRDYETASMSYPVVYHQGHFSLQPPLRFEEGGELHRDWIADDFPRVIVVTFQHPNPYFDDSYAVNSANVGPYGDALMQELIPEVEKRFRVVREPWARALTGGSTGGWEALALQLFHPDFFGGTWAYCPDPVTFSAYEGIDLYEDENAFYKDYGWYRVPTSNIRDTFGQVRLTAEQKNHFELVAGTKGRSGYQMDIWSAVYGPVGEDGYYEPVFDKRTGVVNRDVARYWKENYDLLYYMQKNWATLGPKIEGKLHVYTGDMDTFYLDKGVVLMQEWMKSTENPHYEGFFLYGDRKPHCWIGPVTEAERLREIAQYMLRRKPEGTTTPWWSY
jgi:S-formylglutathione hydrolase FrmB